MKKILLTFIILFMFSIVVYCVPSVYFTYNSNPSDIVNANTNYHFATFQVDYMEFTAVNLRVTISGDGKFVRSEGNVSIDGDFQPFTISLEEVIGHLSGTPVTNLPTDYDLSQSNVVIDISNVAMMIKEFKIYLSNATKKELFKGTFTTDINISVETL